MSRLRPVLALLAALALACGDPVPPPPPPPVDPPPGAALVTSLAELPDVDVAALAAGPDGWYLASRGGRIWRVGSEGRPHLVVEPASPVTLSSMVVAGDHLYWALVHGLFRADLDGEQVQTLSTEHVRALASAGDHACWATVEALWCEGTVGSQPLVTDTQVLFDDELAASGTHVAWVEHGPGEVWVIDRATGQRQRLAQHRKPHALSLDGARLAWKEGEAELLPGRAGGTFLATLDEGAWTVQSLALDNSPAGMRLSDGCLYAPAACAAPSDGAWTNFDLGEGWLPLAVGPTHWAWVSSGAGQTLRAAPRSACCGTSPGGDTPDAR